MVGRVSREPRVRVWETWGKVFPLQWAIHPRMRGPALLGPEGLAAFCALWAGVGTEACASFFVFTCSTVGAAYHRRFPALATFVFIWSI